MGVIERLRNLWHLSRRHVTPVFVRCPKCHKNIGTVGVLSDATFLNEADQYCFDNGLYLPMDAECPACMKSSTE